MNPAIQQRPRADRRAVPGSAAFDASNPFIYLGTRAGTKKALARAGALIAPIDADPETLRWPVAGLYVLLVTDADDERKRQASTLAGVLIRDGANLVSVVCPDGPVSFHRREAA